HAIAGDDRVKHTIAHVLAVAAPTALFPARLSPARPRHDPQLEQVHRLLLRPVELLVDDALARRHHLHFAGVDEPAVAKIIAVADGAVEHVGHDLHVAVRVGGKATAALDHVVVEDAQLAP